VLSNEYIVALMKGQPGVVVNFFLASLLSWGMLTSIY